MHFLLLQGDKDSYWSAFLAEVIAPMGNLSIAVAQDWITQKEEEPDGLIIVDATNVEQFEKLVSTLCAEKPQRRVVVMTASPTWQRARAAFDAGAIDYLPKTLPIDELQAIFKQLLQEPLPIPDRR